MSPYKGKIVAVNKKARFDYDILETVEAGLMLTGQEVKSAKLGHVSLKGAFVVARGGEAYLLNANITRYKYDGSKKTYDPTHSRKLLLHKKEIDRLRGKIQEEGLTAVPLSVYIDKSRVKVEIGLGKGRKQYEKRDVLKKRAVEREMRTAMKGE